MKQCALGLHVDLVGLGGYHSYLHFLNRKLRTNCQKFTIASMWQAGVWNNSLLTFGQFSPLTARILCNLDPWKCCLCYPKSYIQHSAKYLASKMKKKKAIPNIDLLADHESKIHRSDLFKFLEYLIQSSIHSFNKHLLNVYFVPGTVIGTKNIWVNKIDENFCSHGAYILLRGGEQKMNNKLNEQVGYITCLKVISAVRKKRVR